MRLRSETLLSLLVVVLASWGLLVTLGWSLKTALYPRVVGVPLLVLAAIELVLSLRKPHGDAGGTAMDFALSASVDPSVALRRTVGMFAWLVGFFLAIVLLGFPAAIPVFVLAYLRGGARERWLPSLLLVATAWLLFYGLFDRLLHLPFPRGLLLRLLG